MAKARSAQLRGSLRGVFIGFCFGSFVTWGRWHEGQGLHLYLVVVGAAMGFIVEYLIGGDRGD